MDVVILLATGKPFKLVQAIRSAFIPLDDIDPSVSGRSVYDKYREVNYPFLCISQLANFVDDLLSAASPHVLHDPGVEAASYRTFVYSQIIGLCRAVVFFCEELDDSAKHDLDLGRFSDMWGLALDIIDCCLL